MEFLKYTMNSTYEVPSLHTEVFDKRIISFQGVPNMESRIHPWEGISIQNYFGNSGFCLEKWMHFVLDFFGSGWVLNLRLFSPANLSHTLIMA